MRITFLATLTLGLVLLGGRSARGGNDWPQFRGPTGLGYTDQKNLPVQWDQKSGKNVRWKSALVGEGHASPIVSGGRLFVCTVRWPEAVREREKVIPEQHVLCYRNADGKLLWDTLVPAGPWVRNDFRSGPGGGYACPTPTTDGRRVYCVFGSAMLAAVDFDGKLLWHKAIIPYTFDVTVGSSPILDGENLLMFCPMTVASDSALVAYDKQSGKERWRAPLPGTSFGHSTPVLISAGGRRQLLVLAGGMDTSPQGLQALDPRDGKRLWWCSGGGESASAAYASGIACFDSGRGSALRAVAVDGSGDVSKTHVRWTASGVSGDLSSPVIVDKFIYRLSSAGVLKSFGMADGKPVQALRLEGLGTTWASPVADPNGRIYFANAGKSFVIQSGEKFKILAVNDLGDSNHPSPAVADDCLYLVGAKQVFCVGAKP
ncbi:MAG: PQQ-binding-like beta-propeller repeat protein [Thermoguttaceae bacterium]